MCVSQTQLQSVCLCENACVKEQYWVCSLKRGVALTSEINHLCVCVSCVCLTLTACLPLMRSIPGVTPLYSHCYIYHYDYNAITASTQWTSQGAPCVYKTLERKSQFPQKRCCLTTSNPRAQSYVQNI